MNSPLQQAILRLISRKFLIVVGMLVSSHWLMNYGHISDQVYMYVILGTVAVYITGNVTQNIKLTKDVTETATIGEVSHSVSYDIPNAAWDKAVNTIVEQIKATLAQSKPS